MEEPDFTPPPKRGRRKAVAAESFEPNATDDINVVIYEKTDDQLKFLRDATSNILFFTTCDEEQQKVLFSAMFKRHVVKDELIIRQGDVGDNLYIIENGEYDIFVHNDDHDKRVATLNKGYFGELALLYNCPRNATIIARTTGVLWGLDQKTFREIVVNATARKREAFKELLKGVSMLDSLTPCELMDLTDALAEMHFKRHQCIIKEGDQAEKMYFIMAGEASVRVTDKRTHRETEIVRLKRGQYFGEFALVLNTPRVASVYVESDNMKCAVLDISAFERLLGPCVEIMKRNIDNYERERKRLGINSIADDIHADLSSDMGNITLH